MSNPKIAAVQVWGGSTSGPEREAFSGLSGLPPKRLHAPSPRLHAPSPITLAGSLSIWEVYRQLASQLMIIYLIIVCRGGGGHQECVSFCSGRERVRFATLAHRNRSNFGDLRLRCPLRTPEIASGFADKAKQYCIAIQGCDGKSLAICDFELRFLSVKPLAIWRHQRRNR